MVASWRVFNELKQILWGRREPIHADLENVILVDAIGNLTAPKRGPAHKIGAIPFAHHQIARFKPQTRKFLIRYVNVFDFAQVEFAPLHVGDAQVRTRMSAGPIRRTLLNTVGHSRNASQPHYRIRTTADVDGPA